MASANSKSTEAKEAFWQEFLGTKPSLEQVASVFSTYAMPVFFREKAATYLMAINTRQSLLLVASGGCAAAETREQALNALVSVHIDSLSEEELTIVAKNNFRNEVTVNIANFVLKKRIKRAGLLSYLIQKLPKGSEIQAHMAELAMDLSVHERQDVLEKICHCAGASMQAKAIEEIIKNPTKPGLTTVITIGNEEQKKRAGRLMLAKFCEFALDAYFLLWTVEDVNLRAWQIFLTKHPRPKDFAAVALYAKLSAIREAAWEKVKESNGKSELREVVRYSSSPFQKKAAELLMAHAEYDLRDAELIGSSVEGMAQAAKDRLRRADNPEAYIRLMKECR